MAHQSLDADGAASIVADFLHQRVLQVTPLLGRGMVNAIFVVRTTASTIVLRAQNDAHAVQIYHKEQWCIEHASAVGVPGPQVLAIGQCGSSAYMLQSFVAGVNGAHSTIEPARMWHALGQYARVVHAVPVHGYSDILSDPLGGVFSARSHDGFDGSWSGYIQYNVASLAADDPLLALGVLTPPQMPVVQALFEALHDRPFTFGLTHGDLSLKNTVVDDTGVVHLLDWGNAAVAMVPHAELVNLFFMQIIEKQLTDVEMQAFLAGYNLSASAFAQLQADLAALLLLERIDKLRWALAWNPQRVPTYTTYAQQAVRYALEHLR